MYLPELHQEFLTYLEVERNYSPRTITAYRSDFRAFLDYLRQRDIQAAVDAIHRQAVRGYIAWMHRDGLASTSVVRHINSLRSFWNYLRDEDYA